MSARVSLLQRQLMIARMVHNFIGVTCDIKLKRMTNSSVTGWYYEKLGLMLVVNIPRDSEVTAESALDPNRHGACNCGDIEFYANGEISVMLKTISNTWIYHPSQPGTAPTYLEIVMDKYVTELMSSGRLQAHEALNIIIHYIKLKVDEAAMNEDLTVGSRTVPRIE